MELDWGALDNYIEKGGPVPRFLPKDAAQPQPQALAPPAPEGTSSRAGMDASGSARGPIPPQPVWMPGDLHMGVFGNEAPAAPSPVQHLDETTLRQGLRGQDIPQPSGPRFLPRQAGLAGPDAEQWRQLVADLQANDARAFAGKQAAFVSEMTGVPSSALFPNGTVGQNRAANLAQKNELDQLRGELLTSKVKQQPVVAAYLQARLNNLQQAPDRAKAQRDAANERAVLRMAMQYDAPVSYWNTVRQSLGLQPWPSNFKVSGAQKRAPQPGPTFALQLTKALSDFAPEDQGRIAQAIQQGKPATGVQRVPRPTNQQQRGPSFAERKATPGTPEFQAAQLTGEANDLRRQITKIDANPMALLSPQMQDSRKTLSTRLDTVQKQLNGLSRQGATGERRQITVGRKSAPVTYAELLDALRASPAYRNNAKQKARQLWATGKAVR